MAVALTDTFFAVDDDVNPGVLTAFIPLTIVEEGVDEDEGAPTPNELVGPVPFPKPIAVSRSLPPPKIITVCIWMGRVDTHYFIIYIVDDIAIAVNL